MLASKPIGSPNNHAIQYAKERICLDAASSAAATRLTNDTRPKVSVVTMDRAFISLNGNVRSVLSPGVM